MCTGSSEKSIVTVNVQTELHKLQQVKPVHRGVHFATQRAQRARITLKDMGRLY